MNDFYLRLVKDETAEQSEAYQDAMRDMLRDSLNDEEGDMQYEITDEMMDRIDREYSHLELNGDQGKRAEGVRELGSQLALLVVGSTPVSREQSLSLTYLKQSILWAVESISNEV